MAVHIKSLVSAIMSRINPRSDAVPALQAQPRLFTEEDQTALAGQLVIVDAETNEILAHDHDFAAVDVQLQRRDPERMIYAIQLPKNPADAIAIPTAERLGDWLDPTSIPF